MKILLTGASSYVGARLYHDLKPHFEVIGTYHDTRLSNSFARLDITNPEEIAAIVAEARPNIIIHAAANASSRWCEAHPQAAILLNQESTKNLVSAANKINAPIILISSHAAMNPVDVYGHTKRASEEYVKRTDAGYNILRPSLIIGYSPNTANDRPFNRILKNLDEKTEAVYDTSWQFQPTYIGHLSEVIIEVIKRKILNETIAITVPELKSRYDIAADILKDFGIMVKPVNLNDSSPVTIDNLEKLRTLQLPRYTYVEIVQLIQDEIRNREKFELK